MRAVYAPRHQVNTWIDAEQTVINGPLWKETYDDILRDIDVVDRRCLVRALLLSTYLRRTTWENPAIWRLWTTCSVQQEARPQVADPSSGEIRISSCFSWTVAMLTRPRVDTALPVTLNSFDSH